MRKFRVRYNESSDSFVMEADSGDGWDTVIISQCKHREGEEGVGTPALYVHCNFILKMREFVARGYTMVER